MISHTFGEGKYTVIFHDSGKLESLRYDEKWRDLTGDGLILAMLQDYDFLKEQFELANQQLDSLINEVDYLHQQNTGENL